MTNLSASKGVFRSFAFATVLGNIGSGMFAIFMMWVVHAAFLNPVYTGFAGFAFSAPLFLSFVVGPIVDRLNKIKILRMVQFIKLCVAGAVLYGHTHMETNVWFYLVSILIFSIASLFGTPAQTAALPQIVDTDDIVKANLFLQRLGIFGGLLIGAVLYYLIRQGYSFAIVYSVITGTFALSLLLTLILKSKYTVATSTSQKYFEGLKNGFLFIKKSAILPVLFFMATMGLFSQLAYVNFPEFAYTYLGTAQGYILLSALALVGGLVGTLVIGVFASKFNLGKFIVLTFIAAGIARIAFVQIIPDNTTRAIWVYVLYVGLASAIALLHKIIIQKTAPKELISRVDTTIISICAITGGAGALIGGYLGSELENINHIFLLQGASYIGIGILLLASKKLQSLPNIKNL